MSCVSFLWKAMAKCSKCRDLSTSKPAAANCPPERCGWASSQERPVTHCASQHVSCTWPFSCVPAELPMARLFARAKYRWAGSQSESRNTIREGDTIEALRLTHDNRIIDTTRGVCASNAVHKGSPKVRGQVRAILHLIGEVRLALPAHFHLRRPDRGQDWSRKGELPHCRACEVASGSSG